MQPERPMRRAKPRDVVLDAADAVADTYRDRLQNILEQQDGLGWLDAVDVRRAASFIRDGKPVPRPYDSLEPRAVLNCLARDPAGLQLIPEAAATKARQLSGLVNDAVHPKPQAPLTEADGYRAWQLYTDIHRPLPRRRPLRPLTVSKPCQACAPRRLSALSAKRAPRQRGRVAGDVGRAR